MYFLLSIGVIVIAAIFISDRYTKAILRKKWNAIKDNWGRLKNDSFNFYQIEKYTNKGLNRTFHKLSEQTLIDIDFNELFMIVDRTTSRVGQQYLFDKLRNPSNDLVQLKKFNANAAMFLQNLALREKVQKILFSLHHNDAYAIQSLLDKDLLSRPWWFKYLFISPLVLVSLIVIGLKYPLAMAAVTIPLVVNSILHFYNKSTSFSFTISFPQLSQLITVSEQMNSIDELRSDDVQQHVNALKSFQRKYQFLKFGADSPTAGDLNIIGYYLSELIKGFTLAEVFIFYNLTRELENKQKSIQTLFAFVGETDCALSTASLRDGILETCIPEFIGNAKQIEMVDGYHPLIFKCVPNSLSVDGRSVLITGSNMSGKTTFLRAVVINALLAQTLYTCFARALKTPFLKHYSSIRIQDNVLEGKSLYFQEVYAMQQLVSAAESETPCLFILDEVFKGTNTIERIAASKALLSYLNQKNNIVLVATHDYELNDLLKDEYDLYHFTELMDGNDMRFDHSIKKGPHETRNAIRVLEVSNFPKSITAEARKLSDLFVNNLKYYQSK